MQFVKSVSFRILALIVAVGLLVACFLAYQRYEVEKADTTVEMIYDLSLIHI